jgi:hypothetical protein
VVCNGCTDATAEVAGGFGEPVRVLECAVASKSAALNMGDAAAGGFPRFYVDADVVLSRESLEKVAEALGRPGVCAAAPRARTQMEQCSWAVRAWYSIWMDTPYFQDGMMGCGVYALNERGRERFERFPDLIADDGFIRALFGPDERVSVADAEVLVEAPRTLRSLVKAKTRSRLGGYELREAMPELFNREKAEKDYGRVVASWAARPWRLPSATLYATVNVLARLRARRQLRRLGSYRWERDETTRKAGITG